MSACIFRPPWPDEMRRFADLVGTETPGRKWLRPRVWETPKPGRFAGAAWWSPVPAENSDTFVEVEVALRPKYLTPALASELLQPLFAEIREAGFAQARLVLTERESWEKVLGPFGLQWTGCDEFWMVDSIVVRDRMQAHALRTASRQPAGWSARAIAESDWDFIQHRSGAAKFLFGPNFDRVRQDFDAALSSVVETPAGPAGVLLATRSRMTVALEFLGTAPEWRAEAGWVTCLAVMRLCRSEPVTQFDRLVFTTNPALTSAARNLGRRFQGQLVRTYHHFSGKLRDPVEAHLA